MQIVGKGPEQQADRCGYDLKGGKAKRSEKDKGLLQLLGTHNDMATIRLKRKISIKLEPNAKPNISREVGGQAVLGRQGSLTTPWLT